MKALLTILSLVVLVVVPVHAESPRVLYLRQEFPFNGTFASAPVANDSVVILDTYTVHGKTQTFVTDRLIRDLEKRFKGTRTTLPVEVARENSLLNYTTDDKPLIGPFTGSANTLRKLQGGYKVNFGGMPTTLYFKSGVRWHLNGNPNTLVVIRASRFASISIQHKYRDQHDFFEPIKVIVGKIFK